ncbi:MAG: YeeE/YedE family protein [Alphaproteobacteria bacterium]|nr:YeeE/YedE family protein [Alphaproteobacteria bacterium]
MIELSDAAWVTLIGFAGGTVLGVAARIARFCTLGAIEDALYGGTRDRLLMWPLALGVAIATTFALAALDQAAIESSLYLRFEVSIAASVVGGLMFGIGMAIAGNCGFGALARVGGGDFRSAMIVVAIGITAYMTAIGPLSQLRLWLFPRVTSASLEDSGIAYWVQGATGTPPLITALLVAAALILCAVSNRRFLSNRQAIFWSVMVGLAITSAWWGTTYIARHSFDPIAVESHTFTMPLGETILQAMTATRLEGGFSVGSVLGVLFGAFVGTLAKRQFRWEACDDPGELRRQLIGAMLMGTGGVIALGCSVGQAMSAMSVLAISAPITAVSILIGATLGLRHLVEGQRGLRQLVTPILSVPRVIRRILGI